jgi:hypothetical protein
MLVAATFATSVALYRGLFAAHKRKHHHKKHSKGASAIGWMLLFLTSGRMPPPPPESQIEQDLKARNNRSESAGEETDR